MLIAPNQYPDDARLRCLDCGYCDIVEQFSINIPEIEEDGRDFLSCACCYGSDLEVAD